MRFFAAIIAAAAATVRSDAPNQILAESQGLTSVIGLMIDGLKGERNAIDKKTRTNLQKVLLVTQKIGELAQEAVTDSEKSGTELDEVHAAAADAIARAQKLEDASFALRKRCDPLAIDKETSDLKEAQGTVAQDDDVIAKLKQQIADEQAKTKAAEQERDDLKQKLSAAVKTVDGTQLQLKSEEELVASRDKDIAALKQSESQLAATVSALESKSERAILEDRVKSLTKANAKLQVQCAHKVATAQQKAKDAKDAADDAASTLKSVQAAGREQMQRATQCTNELSGARQLLSELKEDKAHLLETVQQMVRQGHVRPTTPLADDAEERALRRAAARHAQEKVHVTQTGISEDERYELKHLAAYGIMDNYLRTTNVKMTHDSVRAANEDVKQEMRAKEEARRAARATHAHEAREAKRLNAQKVRLSPKLAKFLNPSLEDEAPVAAPPAVAPATAVPPKKLDAAEVAKSGGMDEAGQLLDQAATELQALG